MDDFVISNLRESKDEWCCYLVDLLSPLVKQGIQSMFQQAWIMCLDKNETDKYLLTFQNLLTLISKWNSITIEDERKRIVEQSGCSYLEELIVCVHIIHLKVMTHIRVGSRQKKIDISLPKLDDFIHKVYINSARQVYKNVYLFERNLEPLVQQKYNRELELIIQQAILTTVRDSIPKEQIIRSFLDENTEMEEEIVVEPIVASPVPSTHSTLASTSTSAPTEYVEQKEKEKEAELLIPAIIPSIQDLNTDKVVTQIKFNDFAEVLKSDGNIDKEPILSSSSSSSSSYSPSSSFSDDLSLMSLNDLGITDLSPSTSSSSSSSSENISFLDNKDAIPLLDIQEI